MPMQFGFITARIILPLLLCYPTNFLNFPFSFSIIAVCFFLTSSLRHPKIFVKEFSDFLMSCHQHCLGVNLLVQR